MSPGSTTMLLALLCLGIAGAARNRLAASSRTIGRIDLGASERPASSRPTAPVHVLRQMLREVADRRWVRPVSIVVAVLVLGPWGAAAVTGGVWCVARAVPLLNLRRTARQISAAVPEAIELLVLLVHAGLTPHQAIRAIAEHGPPPIASGFEAVAARVDRGVPLADALGVLPERLGPELAAVSDTLAIAVRHGTPISDALAQLSADARLRRRRLAEADARRLPVRLSFPLVFCTLPSFVLVAIAPAVLAALSSLGETSW